MERYGLFKKLADGAPMWVRGEDDLASAIIMINDLDRQTGLEHFIHDFRTGTIIATSRSRSPSAKEIELKEERQVV